MKKQLLLNTVELLNTKLELFVDNVLLIEVNVRYLVHSLRCFDNFQGPREIGFFPVVKAFDLVVILEAVWYS